MNAKKSRQQERLILALLEQPTLEKAAAAAGMSFSTAYRIRKTPEFQAAYRQARSQAVSDTFARIQQASGAAATTILKIMVDPSTSTTDRLRAAHHVFTHGMKSVELNELLLHIGRLEALAQENLRSGRTNKP